MHGGGKKEREVSRVQPYRMPPDLAGTKIKLKNFRAGRAPRHGHGHGYSWANAKDQRNRKAQNPRSSFLRYLPVLILH